MKIPACLGASAFLVLAMSAAAITDQFDIPNHSGFHPPSHPSPTVQIITPQDGAAFLVGDDIQICADADYFTNPVDNVVFLANTNVLGVVSNGVWSSDVFCLSISNLTAGPYQLTAIATDADGLSVTSPPVDITVVTDFPPKVAIFTPCDGAVILGPTNILIDASAYDPDGTVASVQFFEGTNSLGTVLTPPVVTISNRFGVFPIKEPYSVTWSNAPVGSYVLTAVATDNAGLSSTSAPVSITVVTDLPPRVQIVFPERGATYRDSANVKIGALASAPGGSVTQVQFFAGTNSLGVVTTPVLYASFGPAEGLYSLTWSNASPGSYALTAVATDNAGLNATSAPVDIKVLPPPPPEVIITQPYYGETFYGAPTNIDICSWEQNFTNPVVNVQFYAGTNSVGSTTNAPSSCIVLSNAPPGTYFLKAVATDSHSLSVTSAPVGIFVTTNLPTPPRHKW